MVVFARSKLTSRLTKGDCQTTYQNGPVAGGLSGIFIRPLTTDLSIVHSISLKLAWRDYYVGGLGLCFPVEAATVRPR